MRLTVMYGEQQLFSRDVTALECTETMAGKYELTAEFPPIERDDDLQAITIRDELLPNTNGSASARLR